MQQDKKIEQHAKMFKALSNSHRLILFLRLVSLSQDNKKKLGSDDFRCSVGKIGEGLNIAPSTLSHHLKELNQAGLVKMKRSGRTIECWVEKNIEQELTCFFKGS